MPRYWCGFASALLLISSLGIAFVAAAAGNCQYVLGFKALYELIPDTVGECVENVRYNAGNGDALQNSEKGLLVWRKADNFTAFTDGYRTWVNGPFGVQRRLNTERFGWEKDGGAANLPDASSAAPAPASAPTPGPTSTSSCSLPADTVKFGRFVPDYGGAAYGQGVVHNPCDEPMNISIDVFANASKDGPAVMDAPTLWVSSLAPRATKTIGVRVPMSASSAYFSWQFNRYGSSQWCVDADGAQCAWVEPELSSAYEVLADIDEGKPLVAAAARNGIRVMRGDTPRGLLGYFAPSTKTVIIARQLDGFSSWVRAAVVGHELQHAADYPIGSMPAKGSECYEAEDRAFRTQAAIWNRLWQGRLPRDADSVHAELNDIVSALSRDPEAFGIAMSIQYGQECGE